MNNIKILLYLFSGFFSSCHEAFLDERPDKSQVVPLTIEDVQYMLNNTVMNESSRVLATIGADEYFYTESEWSNLGIPTYRNGYRWADEIFDGDESMDWNYGYQKVLYSNIALEKLDELNPSGTSWANYERAKGTALFHRANTFYELLQIFALPYLPEGENDHPGIVLKLDSDIENNPGRSSVRECYDRIIADLELANTLLPLSVPTKVNPSRYAAMALLSRVYLATGDYRAALGLCEAIMQNFELIDYTTYVKVGTLSFPANVNDNQEVIYSAIKRFAVTQANYSLSEDLLESYDDNDHRKRLFFRTNRNKQVFSGSYLGGTASFVGLALDEIYLIAIECCIHINQMDKAKAILAEFLEKRYEVPKDLSQDDLLDVVFQERKKQLLLRGLRWEDLRRLNFVLNKQIRVVRPAIDGVVSVLEPNSRKYMWPIPDSAVKLGGLLQNER